MLFVISINHQLRYINSPYLLPDPVAAVPVLDSQIAHQEDGCDQEMRNAIH
jgi:hypothetical protein